MNLRVLATGATTTTLVLGAVVSLAPGQNTESTDARVASLKFDHQAHAALETPVAIAQCELCHGNDAKGALGKPASHGHQPCLSSGCHAEDFLSVGKRTQLDAPERYKKAAGFCLGCHDDGAGLAPSPFVKAQATSLYKNNTKPGHYVEMNHLAHTKAAEANGGGCRTCHVVDQATFVLAVDGPGHAECASCHDGIEDDNRSLEPDFAMGACGSCHQSGDPKAYFKERSFTTDVRSCKSLRHAALSKKRNTKTPCFEHEREGHRTKKDGDPVQCGHCHFMFSSKRYEGHGYQSLLDVTQAPIMDNSRDRAHNKCGSSGCHHAAVDESKGTGKCALCHSSKSILDSLTGGSNSHSDSGDSLVDDPKPRKRRRKKPSLDDLVN